MYLPPVNCGIYVFISWCSEFFTLAFVVFDHLMLGGNEISFGNWYKKLYFGTGADPKTSAFRLSRHFHRLNSLSVCNTPLGMETGVINVNQLSSSSVAPTSSLNQARKGCCCGKIYEEQQWIRGAYPFFDGHEWEHADSIWNKKTLWF